MANHDACAEMFEAEYKLADLLAGEIRHVLEEGCVDDCLVKALAIYEAHRSALIDGPDPANGAI